MPSHWENVMTTAIIPRGIQPTSLNEAMQDLMSLQDQRATSQRLVQKLTSFASGDVDLLELDETQLRLQQADGTPLRFRVHPQGMELDQETGLLYITAVEIIEAPDAQRRQPGKGRAHLFECNIEGKTIRSVSLKSENEDEYHPSGMVLIDGTMFIALAQYRPESSSTIIKFNVRDWTYEKLFRIQDHIGLVIPNLDERELLLGTWGSRHYYRTDLNGNVKSKRSTPCSDQMEHQDAQLIGASCGALESGKLGSRNSEQADREDTMILATGVTAGGMEHFGLEIIDVANWRIKTSLRWPSAQHLTKGGWPPFANPTYLWIDSDDRILALATPDDCHEQSDKEATLILYMLCRRD
jgi:hypothetical protein